METILEDDASQEQLQQIPRQQPNDSQTASEFIDQQLALEADAREVLPYKFDKCTNILGPLRQELFACLTCNPPPASPAQVYTPAGVCYACSISCHGDHTLVELFNRRNFVCDCGTTRISSTPCTLRSDPSTGSHGVTAQEPSMTNSYNHNFQNKFCACGEEYNAETEKGTMFQCVGLGTPETGGCGEDWYHPECLMGLPRMQHTKSKDVKEGETEPEAPPNPDGFPDEDDFDAFVCYKCVESNPWIKAYAGTEGFLQPLMRSNTPTTAPPSDPTTTTTVAKQPSLKRKASDDDVEARSASPVKRLKEEDATIESNTRTKNEDVPTNTTHLHKHEKLPLARPGIYSIFMKEGFREQFCHCPKCYPNLLPHPQLVEEEDAYEPSVSEDNDSGVGAGSGTRSQGTGSLLDRGEAALSTMDRVKAIEGVMVYNHLKDKVKAFLKPYAETGKPVSAEDIKEYFEKLRGDEAAIKEAGTRPIPGNDDDSGDNRREQSGY